MYFHLNDKDSKEERDPNDIQNQYENLIIKESNPIKLMELYTKLSNQTSIGMQIIINEYLREVTSGESAFVLFEFNLTDETIIQVVGGSRVKRGIRVDNNNELMKTLKRDFPNEAVIVNIKCIPPEVVQHVNNDLYHHSHSGPLRNILFIPIYTPGESEVTFWVGLANPEMEATSALRDQALARECYRYCVTLVKNTMRYEEMKAHHVRAKQLITALMSFTKNIGNTRKLNDVIKFAACDLFDAEKCGLYLKEERSLVSRTTNYGAPFDFMNYNLFDISIPVGTGVAGMSASCGEIVNSVNPEKEKYFCNTIDKLTNTKTRNLFAFPMLHQDNLFGVIELANKIKGPFFTKLDEKYAQYFGKISGSALHHSLSLRKRTDNYDKKLIINSFLLRHIKVNTNEIHDIFKITDIPDIEMIASYSLLPSLIEEQYSVLSIMSMFSHLNLLNELSIPPIKLLRFVMSVKRSHNALPFFNWFHTFSCFHFAFLLLKKHRLRESEYIFGIEAFAFLIAVLCHHMDFRGSTSCFQVTSGTVLESLYSSPGCISRLQIIGQTLRLLLEPGCTILENFDEDQFHTFMSLIDILILATDYGEYLSKVADIDLMILQEYQYSNQMHRTLLLVLLMMCCELSDHARPWKHCREAGAKLINEFIRQTDEPFAEGIFCFPDLDYKPKVAECQMHLLTTVVLPVFTHLSKLIPSTEMFLATIKANTDAWQNVRNKLKKDKVDVINEVFADDDDQPRVDDYNEEEDDDGLVDIMF